MNEETIYQGFEPVEPENPFERRKHRFNYQCERCGHAFSKIALAAPKNNPNCTNPACEAIVQNRALAQQVANLTRMLEAQQPPGHIGANNTIKAVDYTAETVMRDYNLTNLKDNIREGESVAPNLPPAQQKQADNFFGGQIQDTKIPDFKTGRPHMVRKKSMELIVKRALAGSYANRSVNPISVIPNAARGGSPIVRVRTEPNPGAKPGASG